MGISWDEEPDVPASAAGEYYVRHLIGGKPGMVWMDLHGGFTDELSRAKKMDETAARLAAEGFRVTYKDQDRYVFDVVPVENAETLIKADKLAQEAAVKAATGASKPTAAGSAAPAVLPPTSHDEGYEERVNDGDLSVDEHGFYVDDDGDRMRDSEYYGGYARRGFHNEAVKDRASLDGSPTTWALYDGRAANAEDTATFADNYEHVVSKLGEPNVEGDGWTTNAIWRVRFGDGKVAQVFDHKQAASYDDDLPEWSTIASPSGPGITWTITGDGEAVKRLVSMLA